MQAIPAPLADALNARGYTDLTGVQSAVLAPEAEGRDLIVSAQTGSGKTVAFGLAMARRLLADADALAAGNAPLALVVAPTRELALQVSLELGWLYVGAGARIATCVGGMDPSKERRMLSRGAHIVVGTPGRLCDHIRRGALDLGSIRYVVLDEADEMLDMGFREDLEAILEATPEARNTLLFSATMPKPILALARRYQRDMLRISTVSADAAHADIQYRAVTIAPSETERAVVNLLRFHEAQTAMLFCATRENVRQLHEALTARGFAAVALSGEHSQKERNSAIAALRDGRARICVATDVAARGIDIASLSLVIHVEIPRDAEVLQHRSGRTGRAGNKGTAILLVPHTRRKRVEAMLREAKIRAWWEDVPTAEMVRNRDRERLLSELGATPAPAEAGETEMVAALLAQKSPQEIALALLRSKVRHLPAPEDFVPAPWSPAEKKKGKKPFAARRADKGQSMGKPKPFNAKAKPRFKGRKAG